MGTLQVASWSYAYEMAVETTRIILSEVVTAADVAALQSGTEAEKQQVKDKISMVQELITGGGGVPAVGGTACCLQSAGLCCLPAMAMEDGSAAPKAEWGAGPRRPAEGQR